MAKKEFDFHTAIQQRSPVELWEENWDDLGEVQRNLVTILQKLPAHFCEKHWDEFTPLQRKMVADYQKFTK
jgi:hypothetical protein